MKSLKTFVILITLIIAASMHLQAIIVSPGGTHYNGSSLTFRPTSSNFGNAYSAAWDFGDGGTWTVTYGLDPVTHSYNQPGIYTVTVTGTFSLGGPVTETTTVIIEPEGDSRTITVSPVQPTVGMDVTFTGNGFYTPNNVRWEMGDGAVLRGTQNGAGGLRSPFDNNKNRFNNTNRFNNENFPRVRSSAPPSRPMGSNVVHHTYTQSGTYTVRAFDFNGQATIPVTAVVVVNLPARTISVSPAQPFAGVPVTFTATNFLSTLVDWNFGDGNSQNAGSVSVAHVYNNAGSYTVTAKETNSNYPLVSVVVVVSQPNRQISFLPQAPRADQMVYFQAASFITSSIDWNFGDGTIVSGGSASATHRFVQPGSYTVSAKESTIQHPVVSTTVVVLEENRYIIASPPEVRTNENVTATAFNFRDNMLFWDFGDGTVTSGGHSEIHTYARAGTYTISAQDENGESQVKFSTTVIVRGIDDEVNLEIAEIRLDNGKYYKVVPRNSKYIRAVLRMKMRGTGIVSGYWLMDGHPFEFFNEVVNQGQLKEIFTRTMPGLPTIQPGLHTVTVQLTRPSEVPVTFPILKYFVTAHESTVEITSPLDGFIAKENEIPEFSWGEPKGASTYQLAFSDHLYPLMEDSKYVKWLDLENKLKFTPEKSTWDRIQRNKWTYWKVRALDTSGNIVAESPIQEIKVVIAVANIMVDEITDLNGKKYHTADSGKVRADVEDLLVHGRVQYMGASKYIVLRVYVDDVLTDQLLFRDVKKEEIRHFETSLPHHKKQSRVRFQVLKTSSPAVIVGLKGLILEK